MKIKAFYFLDLAGQLFMYPLITFTSFPGPSSGKNRKLVSTSPGEDWKTRMVIDSKDNRWPAPGQRLFWSH